MPLRTATDTGAFINSFGVVTHLEQGWQYEDAARTVSVLKELGISDPVLDTARELEQIALKDDYFVEKKLYPNVDFYSGVILNAIGFPTDMFTALFALARTVGWVAQWEEMLLDPEQKIARPKQIYVGSGPRDYVAMEKRK